LPKDVQKDEIRKMEVYAAMIDRLDPNIGILIDALVETGRVDDIMVMFVSDNGASAELVELEDDYGEIGSMTLWSSLGPNWANVSNTPFRYYKNYSYEGGINTPLIACWPGNIDPGSVSRFPGHFIDIMSTFVDITGAKYPNEFNGGEITPMQGQSLLPAILGKTPKRKKPLFWEWSEGQAVRDGEWKLVRRGKESEWELYNLDSDPTETQNLATDDPEIVREMNQKFHEWKSTSTHYERK
jgi:arylsulfatase A-like enzyme